jgi:hypothetical protein
MVAPSETPASALGLEPDTFPDLQDGDLDKWATRADHNIIIIILKTC